LAPYSVNWFGYNPMSLAVGVYSVEITDANGCLLTLGFDISQPDALLVNVATSDVSCSGLNDGTATLTINGGTTPYIENWYGNNPVALASGNYAVEVTDANGCMASSQFTINQPVAPELSFVVTNVINCAGASTGAVNMTITGSYTSILWSNGATTEDLANIPAGIYSVAVFYGNSSDSSSILC